MQHLISHYGYFALFLVSVFSAACLPFPSEVAYGYAGALCTTAFSAHPTFSLFSVVLWGTVGSVVGSVIAYEVGRSAGRSIVDRWGKWILLSHRDLDTAERWFAKYGTASVFFGRLVPFARSFISLPAGLAEMKRGPFLVLTTLGSGVWVLLLAALGKAGGKQWDTYAKGFGDASYVLAAVIVIALIAAIWHRWRSMRHTPRH